ncbi:unnamed protein product, partial [Chrysoparadoxa australica]
VVRHAPIVSPPDCPFLHVREPNDGQHKQATLPGRGNPDVRLGCRWKPKDKRNWPHPANLAWHRENIFGQMASEGPAPWD